MARLVVRNFTISLDGFAAGPRQRADAPFGDGAAGLHDWMFATRAGQLMLGGTTADVAAGTVSVDNDFVATGDDGVGATIMGRHMFGPIRGEWPDESWRGWWGDNPPFHHDVFVLTHHPRPPLEMDGGTRFHFVADTPPAVLARAFEAAAGQDVRLGGGAAAVRQFLHAHLIDELHVVIVPLLLGTGERLFTDWAELPGGYETAELISSDTTAAVHARVVRRAPA